MHLARKKPVMARRPASVQHLVQVVLLVCFQHSVAGQSSDQPSNITEIPSTIVLLSSTLLESTKSDAVQNSSVITSATPTASISIDPNCVTTSLVTAIEPSPTPSDSLDPPQGATVSTPGAKPFTISTTSSSSSSIDPASSISVSPSPTAVRPSSGVIPSSPSTTLPISSAVLSSPGVTPSSVVVIPLVNDTDRPDRNATVQIQLVMQGPCGLSPDLQTELRMSVMEALSNVTQNHTAIRSVKCNSQVQFVLEIPPEHQEELTQQLEHWKHDGFHLQVVSGGSLTTSTVPPHLDMRPEEGMVIYIIIGSLFGLILLIMAIIMCVKCYRRSPVKKAGVPRLSMHPEAYAIARIPRPRTIYTDYCRHPTTSDGAQRLGLVQPFDTSVIPLEDAKKLDQSSPSMSSYPPPPPPPMLSGEMRTFGTSRSMMAEKANGVSAELSNGPPTVSRERLAVSFQQSRSNIGVDNPLYDMQ